MVTHLHHNYYYGRNEADLTSWLEYFIKGVLSAFETVELKANNEQCKGLTADKASILRKLDIKQCKILELLTKYQEITSIQAGQYLGISAQSARLLLNKWIDEGFLRLINTAKKNRTYDLAKEFEDLLSD